MKFIYVTTESIVKDVRIVAQDVHKMYLPWTRDHRSLLQPGIWSKGEEQELTI